MGEKVISLKAIKEGKISDISWVSFKYNKDGIEVPIKCWENLEVILKKHNIDLRLNTINHEIDFIGLRGGSDTRNGRVTDIYSLQTREGLGLSRAETIESINRIAEKNACNPFVEMLVKNENTEDHLIEQVFKCLPINYDYLVNEDFLRELFYKWCINVVKTAHNSLENGYRSQGVLILQGKQGARKSTFFQKLMPNKEWFKGDISINPEKVDSIIQNTKYVLVEWGEFDSSNKHDQAKLKQFITATDDEYRTPYSILSERYPRLTSFCGSVNKLDFLKDETGSRRFWVIPIGDVIDIEALEKIDIEKFWGAVYYLWKNEIVRDYLTSSEQELLSNINSNFNFETDITIILNEKLDWDMEEEEWQVYNITEVAEYLFIRDKNKQIKQELEKKGLVYKSYRLKTGKVKKGFKLPRIEVNLNF